MTGQELFSQIVLSLNMYLDFNDDDLDDLISIDGNLEDGIQKLLSLNPPSPFDSFITSLDKIRRNNDNNFLNTPYSNIGNINFIDFSLPIFNKRNRRIAHSNTEFTFVSTSIFFDNNNLIDFSDDTYPIIWKCTEEFLERIFDNNDYHTVELFFDILANIDTQKGLLVCKTANAYQEEDFYSYIYLSFLNDSNSIVIPSDLTYTSSPILPGLIYDITKNYKQYFDIYDVLNELNQAPDILNRYLRLYHIMEYLVYRVYLVNLINRVGSSRLFVREFIVSAENMKKGEKESFRKNFSLIFSTDLVAIIEPTLSPIINPIIVTFLSDKNIVKSFAANQIDKISDLIYGIRCCIVHNKESEYHLTISNHEDYEVIIPVIKKILEIFENLIIHKIINNNLIINYPQQNINLY
ncbi:MAG: hypothetical protein LUH22_12935 [Bacteroides sp.]|nr:hypothetical protein [Bacteroides sp.]